MKVLLYAMYPPTPLLEIGLEIVCNHLDKGDEVYVLQCTGQLKTCPDNWEHKESVCIRCRSKYRRGLKKAGVLDDHIITLPKKEPSYKGIQSKFRNIDQLKTYVYEGVDLGRAVASSLISDCRDHKPDTVRFQKRIHKELKTNYYVYVSVAEKLDQIKPHIFYAFNGRTSTVLPALKACQDNAVEFYTYDVAFTTDRYFLSKNDTVQSRTNVQNEILELWHNAGDDKEQVGAQFFLNNRGLKQENMHFLYVKDQEENALPPEFDKAKKNIAIFNSSMDEIEALEDWKNPIYRDQNEGIEKILESFRGEQNIKFYLRIHPNLKGRESNSQMQETWEIGSRYHNLQIIPADSSVHTYSLLDACDITLTFGSTVGIEACFWNKPSILIGRSFYEHLDCCYKPSTHEEVVEMIRSELLPKPKIGAYKYGYWAMRMGIPLKRFLQTHVWDPFRPSVHRGKFLGEEINFSRFAYGLSLMYRFLEFRHYPAFIASATSRLRRLFN